MIWRWNTRTPDWMQEWILTFARRRWSVRRIARELGIHWSAVAGCLDGWGVERRRRM